jgi:hypothetical protein
VLSATSLTCLNQAFSDAGLASIRCAPLACITVLLGIANIDCASGRTSLRVVTPMAGILLPGAVFRCNVAKFAGRHRDIGRPTQLITAITSRETKLPGCRVGMIETSAAMGACLLVLIIIVAVVLDRRPYRPGKRNYIPIMIIALAASLVLSRHLLILIAD